MKNNKWLKKFTDWEYWPSYMFYIPNIPYAIYLALKARDFTFYSMVNPGIKNSGNGTESKFETLELVPDDVRPKSILIQKDTPLNSIVISLHKKGIDYPVIAKPDIGFRGMLVQKIYSDEQLKNYIKKYPIPTILQEFIDLPNECGIFYHRMPDAETGRITSVTLKSFIHVKGDGILTLSQLVRNDNRAKHYYQLFEKIHADQWNSVVEKDTLVKLTDIGNHSKGTRFVNGNHLIDKELEAVLDGLSRRIKGWYYGRLDVKYTTIEELKQGKNFTILEINGTISEPTHIYDPYHTTYFRGLKAIREHWKILYKIASVHKKNGLQSGAFYTYWMDIRDLFRYIKKVRRLSKATS